MADEITEVEETEVEVEKPTIGQCVGNGIDAGIGFVAKNWKKAIAGVGIGIAAIGGLMLVTKDSAPALEAEDAGLVDFSEGTEVSSIEEDVSTE